MSSKSLTTEEFEDAEFVHTQTAEDITALQNDADDQINTIFSEVGSDKGEVNYHFQVGRIMKDQAEIAFLFKGTASDLPIMERLRDEYDGGKFQIQIYRNKKRYRRIVVNVEAPKKAAVAALVKNDMAELMKEMGRQQQENFNMLKDTVLQMIGKPTTAQPSQMEMMTGMMMLMKSMKDFVSPQVQQAPSFDPEKMFDMFLKGMEMGKESGGSESGFLDIARDLIKSPLLGQLAQAASFPQLPRTPVKPLVKPVAGIHAEGNIPAQSPPKTPEGENVNNPVIKHYLNMLVSKAEKDSDPVLYAEFILDNIPQATVEEHIAREDLIEYAAKIDPRVNSHKEWFIELRDHIISVLTAPDEQEETGGIPIDDSIPGSSDNATGSPDHVADDTERASRDA